MKAFTEHPQTVGETYAQHLASACSFSATMAVGALCCLLHGLFPFLFETAGSRRVRDLHTRMVTHRTGLDSPGGSAAVDHDDLAARTAVMRDAR